MTNPNDRAEVVMTVPRTVKERWIAESRAQGQKLTDWLLRQIDGQDENDSMTAQPPTPDQIRAARKAAGWTQTEAASKVEVVLRTWQQWEAGERRMHPAFWQLFSIKLAEELSRRGV